MEEILTDVVLYDEASIYQAIKVTRSLIERLNDGKVSTLREELNDYLCELSKEAVKLDVCPVCGKSLRWGYQGTDDGKKILSYVKCVACNFKEVNDD